MCLQASLLKEINRLVEQININIIMLSEIEKEKENMIDRLSLHRNQLKSACNIDSSMSIDKGLLKLEIKNP